MLKKSCLSIVVVLASMSLTGCVALLAGAAGGVGTAVWLSGKLSQEVNGSFERSIDAVKAGLKDLGMPISKQTVEDKSAQVIAAYSDGRTVWIDVHRVSVTATRIDVRVGAAGDKVAARKVLAAITAHI